MNLDHPIIPLLGRVLITYIFATSGVAKVYSCGGDDVEGSLKGPIQRPHRLVPSDPMEFLGPIMVHLLEEFGSHNVLTRFHTSPS